MLAALALQRGLMSTLQRREAELHKVQAEKERIERRLKALASSSVEVQGDRVIMQGEVLFASGSDELRPEGRAFVAQLAQPLGQLLAAEKDQMVMVGGHTDDVPIHNARFASNWDLSTARATAVARALIGAGLEPAQVIASGFGPYHARVANTDAAARAKNRRIEVLLVPITSAGVTPEATQGAAK
jgi:flagellar motor protein MotB